MASTAYDSATRDIANQALTLNGGNLKILLVNGYAPNAKTHAKRSDVTGEVTGTGYSAGGVALSSVVGTLDTTNDKTVYTATNPSWASSTITATGAVVYQSNGGAATGDPLVCYLDFGGTVTSTNGTFSVTSLATTGFLSINKA